MQVLPLIISFLGAIIGAMIGATISPLVQWQFEKKRQKLAYRRELIAKWRMMLEEVARDHSPDIPAKEIHKVLMRKSDYLSMVAHILDPPIQISDDNAKFAKERGLHPVLVQYWAELLELERKWDLV